MLTAARRGATFYAVVWSAFAAAWLAAFVGGRFIFERILDAGGRNEALELLKTAVLITLPLILVANVVLMLTLDSVRPAKFVGTFLMVWVPFFPAVYAVSAAEIALKGVPRAPPLPSSTWTIGLPAGIAAAIALVAFLVEGAGVHQAKIMVGVLVPAFGLVRVGLGLKLRAVFAEVLLRPAVDEAHAMGTDQPVAGG